jgi:hypothetical protein
MNLYILLQSQAPKMPGCPNRRTHHSQILDVDHMVDRTQKNMTRRHPPDPVETSYKNMAQELTSKLTAISNDRDLSMFL